MTEDQATSTRFVELARKLGPGFAARAVEHDASGSFVSDNYAELREHRMMSAGVPSELGGGGASHAELCAMLAELGKHCGSTALALSMHTHLVAANVWRHLHGQPAEPLLRKIAASELVLVSTGAGDWVESAGEVERVPGGYRVSGRKRFASGSPVGDLLLTSAPFQDPERGWEVFAFGVSLKASGVRVCEDWDTVAMRGTGSNTVELDRVFVPEETISVRRPRGVWHPSWSVTITVAPPIYMAPYVGIGERAAELAREAANGRAGEPHVLLALGEMENALLTAQLAFRELIANANGYDFAPAPERANRALMCKTIATNALLSTVNKAVEVIGGGALFKRHPLERLIRDIQASSFHPLPEKKQLTFTGRVALGLPPIAG